ncbi:unnamed protein product [Mytilus coruscus]|uniref:Uncharacterized protein n=1 Tax=Mytilus coruscus TaxID=42192 RepID=A0A6J8DXQ3_MYTCO|nr:unnamed protein product [Mytilus coruscus]
MDLNKLKLIRSGNRGAVTKRIRKIDAAKHDTDFDPEELTARFDKLIQTQKLSSSRPIEQNTNDSPQNMNFPISNGHLHNSPTFNQISVNLVNDTNQKEEDTTILHSSSTEVRTHVLLKTAVAPVWSDHLCQDTRILFDEGSQKYFVIEDLARKLIIKFTFRGNIIFYNYRHLEMETKSYDI